MTGLFLFFSFFFSLLSGCSFFFSFDSSSPSVPSPPSTPLSPSSRLFGCRCAAGQTKKSCARTRGAGGDLGRRQESHPSRGFSFDRSFHGGINDVSCRYSHDRFHRERLPPIGARYLATRPRTRRPTPHEQFVVLSFTGCLRPVRCHGSLLKSDRDAIMLLLRFTSARVVSVWYTGYGGSLV